MSINPDIFRPSQNYYIEEESVGLLVIDSIVDIIFFIDIIFNFHTSFVSNTGEVITNEKKIRRSVSTGWTKKRCVLKKRKSAMVGVF